MYTSHPALFLRESDSLSSTHFVGLLSFKMSEYRLCLGFCWVHIGICGRYKEEERRRRIGWERGEEWGRVDA